MTVKLRESKRIGSRHHEKRRGRRMNSRVPVRLEWDYESGKRIRVEGHTRTRRPTRGVRAHGSSYGGHAASHGAANQCAWIHAALPSFSPLLRHARVEGQRGQWYECGWEHERVAVQQDR